MKMFLIVGVLMLLWNVSAFSGTAPMTDDQLAGVAAGTGELQVNVNNQNSLNQEVNMQPNNNTQQEIQNNQVNPDNQSNNNVVINDNSVIQDASVNTLILQNDVQQNVRAVNIVNTIRGNVINNINANDVIVPSGSSNSGSGGSIPVVNQTNTAVQH